MNERSSPAPLIVLILAGQRASGDALSSIDVSHKAFLKIGGEAMIERVLKAVLASRRASEIWISAPDSLRDDFAFLQNEYGAKLITSASSPSLTIAHAAAAAPDGAQILVTTCDHALLTPEIVAYFLDAIDQEQTDIAAACVSREQYESAYPQTRRTFIRFRDFSFSGANLFWMRPDRTGPLLAFWRRLEENRKSPIKMAMEIGPLTGFLYLTGLLSKKGALNRIKAKTSVKPALIALPFAQAAIDVDRPEDIATVEAALKAHTPTSGAIAD